MKKYVLGFFALAVIVVLSAFTISNDNKKDPTLFYFYEVVNGEINPSAPINDDEPMTLGEFESTFENLCPEGDDADCVRYWEHTYTPTSTELTDDLIRKDLQ